MEKYPKAIGPYSIYRECGSTIYISGQLPVDAFSGELEQGIKAQTKRSLQNIEAILSELNLCQRDVVKTTVFLANMDDFAAMNEIYSEFFSAPYPSRSAVAVKTLPKNALVEIEVIAHRQNGA